MGKNILGMGLGLMLAGVETLPASAQAEVPKIDADIVAVGTAGGWVDNEEQGFYRFIVTSKGFEHISNQLFIQWVVPGAGPRFSTIRAGVGIEEFNKGGWYVFGIPTCIDPSSCTGFELEVTHTYSGERKNIKLNFPAVGQYVLDGE